MMSDEAKREERINRLTTQELFPLIVRMAIPSMIGMMVATIYNMTDTFWVGKLDNEAYTASVGVVFAFVSVIQAIGFWFGYGSGNYISRMLGKKDYEEAERMAANGVAIGAIAGVLILVLGLIFIDPLVSILGGTTSQELAVATKGYLRITICTVPFMLFSNTIYNQLRLSGAAKSSMYGLLVGMLINMVLDPIFILMIHMGVAGAAYASLIGQVAGCAMLWRETGRNGNIAIKAKYLKPDICHIREILAGGAPNFCRQGITSISSVILNNIAGIYGVTVIAAVTVSQRVAYIAYALVIGFGQGFQPVCSFNYGAGKKERVREGFFFCFKYGTLFLTFGAAILIILAEPIVYGLRDDPAVVEVGKVALRWQAVTLPFLAFTSMANMMLQSTGKGVKASIASSCKSGLCFIPCLYILIYFFGIKGLEATQAVADFFSLLIAIPLAVSELAKMKKE